MPLNEREQAIFKGYAHELDPETSGVIRIRLIGGIPTSVADLQTDVFLSHEEKMITDDEFSRALDLFIDLHQSSDPRAEIAELDYVSETGGDVFLIVHTDKDK